MSQLTLAEIKLNDDQLRERAKFDNEKKIQHEALMRKKFGELSNAGPSPEHSKKYELERLELQHKKSKEGQELYDRHQQQFQNEHAVQRAGKPAKNAEMEQEIKALNARYAEERENTRKNAEAFHKEDKSLVEKLKDRWAKNNDKDRDR